MVVPGVVGVVGGVGVFGVVVGFARDVVSGSCRLRVVLVSVNVVVPFVLFCYCCVLLLSLFWSVVPS